jgi:uncharacterized membrane protein YfcA
LFGVGGGLIIVPALYWLLPRMGVDCSVTMHIAIGTSLATIVITSLSSAYSHYRKNAVVFSAFWQLTPGLLIGAALAAVLADFFNTRGLMFVFAVFEVLVALQLLLGFRANPQRDLPGAAGMVGTGTGIGVMSGLVGIGGGTLTVPFLSWCNVPIKKAVGTSAACGLPIAVAGMLAYMLVGWDSKALPANTSGFILWPAFFWIGITSVLFAPLGAWIAHRLKSIWLKRAFAVLLFVVGGKMLWDALSMTSKLAACH